jgi:16S rRNA (cytidine1402-2'-O)-methyltransferase
MSGSPSGKAEGADGEARLAPGLYLVATPIGTASDITLRALDILRRADAIAAEDTRRTRQLMDMHGIPVAGRPMIPYHDHNGAAQRPGLLARLREGQAVALVSDAGTPLVADPGWRLTREAIDAGLPVTAAPGASAVLTALSLSGLPSDRFLFAGFPPSRPGERARWLADLAAVPATLVFYESPHRLEASLGALRGALGNRPSALCRELTKRFEEVLRGTLDDLLDEVRTRGTIKGEIVLVIGAPATAGAGAAEMDAALRDRLATDTVRDAARIVAETLDLPRKQVYQRALALSREVSGKGDADDAG